MRLRRAAGVLLNISRAIAALVALTFLLFSAAALNRERLSAEGGAPKGGRFVQAADAQVFLQEVGPQSGPAVLLIHGTGAWSEIWRDTMTALAADGFHVVAMDVPPFGYSERLHGAEAFSREKQARRIIAVLDALGIRDASLVGHSVGARPTIEAAAAIPSRIRSLVLVDPALGFASQGAARFEQNHPALPMRTIFGARPLLRSIVASYGTNPMSTRKLFRSFVSRPEAVTEERVRMLQRPLAVEGTTAAQSDWLVSLLVAPDTARTSDLANLRALAMPVLLVWGSDDQVTPLWQGEALRTAFPHAELAVIPGAGHIPFIEAPAEFQSLVGRFLGRMR